MHDVSLLSLAHFASRLARDDSSLALIALLAGMVGGWSLSGRLEQAEAKRAIESRKGR